MYPSGSGPPPYIIGTQIIRNLGHTMNTRAHSDPALLVATS
jgi:hypothetical protein